MATLPKVDSNLSSGTRPITFEPAIVSEQRKAMPQLVGKASPLSQPGLAGQSEWAANKEQEAANNSRKNWLNMALGKAQGGINNYSNIISPIAKGIDTVSSGFTTMNDTVSPTTLGIRDSISSAAINSGNPIAMAIGAATKIVDAIGDATGFHIDDIDKEASSRAGVSGGARFLNNAMNALPGNSLVMAAFSPNKTREASTFDSNGESVLAGYSGSQNDVEAAGKISGKRTLFGIGQKKMNSFIGDANQQVDLINEIGRTNTLRKQSDYARDLSQQNLNRYAGTNYMTHAVGKKGMKIMSRAELQQILAKQKLQNGSIIGTDTNILPEGALHARLNHLEGSSENLEDITKKGIPVLDENGDQVAEIEKEELVLRLEVTKKIEELMKDGTEDAMIEAGKLLVAEIIENTQDNTGQITEEVQNG